MAKTLVIGLGNPGQDYANTYHNVGEMALEFFVREAASEPAEAEIQFRKHGGSFEYTKSRETVFVRPLVFMNESGLAAREALNAFAVDLNNLFIIHDESDLPIGEYKITQGGGSAGHKGVQSVIDHVGSSDFWRIRIGVRDPQEVTRKKAGDFVLRPVSEESHEKISAAIALIAEELRAKGAW